MSAGDWVMGATLVTIILLIFGIIIGGALFLMKSSVSEDAFYEDENIECYRSGDENTCYIQGARDKTCEWKSEARPDGYSDIPKQCYQEELH